MRVACRWLVGCDGMRSKVRELAGIEFEGAAYPEGFVLADVEMSWPLRRVQRRHQVAQDVVSMTDRITRMATLQSPLAQSIRNSAISLPGRVPALREGVARKLAELDNR